MKRVSTATVLAALLSALTLLAAPAAGAAHLDPNAVPPRTQITLQFDDGTRIATANSGESRPVLSLSKLYLAHWVLHHGAPADKARVEHMIRVSDDAVASDLDATYPQAIPETISAFGLTQTSYNGYWGAGTTSSDDVARFLSEIRHDPVAAPIFTGMATAAPTAADGYAQNFGTAVVPGTFGTKFGWSNNRDVHATASLGPGWVLVANTYGGSAAHTADVRAAVTGDPAPGVPAPSPGGNGSAVEPGSSGTPTASGAQLKDRLACHDPHNLRQAIPDGALLPVDAVNAVPGC
ncbi:hypothetical protein [Corynebacterium halotolerans]|uniref:Lipoprotein n=1 Tax=Corynebacterium halotolerans YIM 70093 = DSM 44683 TaxID=1121362 RepID=M1NIJ7_9CORY|nr:hypothetical protein [Corynebacterium halotolerans]AGF71248.1 hypothetical protein A605_01170 [Corynebacterium halotolerans YIM 70093 = DSM 44683]